MAPRVKYYRVCDCVSKTQHQSTRAHESPPRSCEKSRLYGTFTHRTAFHTSQTRSQKHHVLENLNQDFNLGSHKTADVPCASSTVKAFLIDNSNTREYKKGRWEAFLVFLKVRMELGTVDLAIVSVVTERFPGPRHGKADQDRNRALTRRAHPRSTPIIASSSRLDYQSTLTLH